MTFSNPLTGITGATCAVVAIVGILFLVSSASSASSAAEPTTDHRPTSQLSDRQRKFRLHHAHELLGRYYKKSSVTVGESIPKINSAVYHWTKDHLPAKFKSQSSKIAQTIIDESTKQQFDPVFLMSVIEGESSWRPEKVGGVGEIGLMQLRPGTGKWMAQRAGVKWHGRKTLFDPCANIKIGAAYLNYLRDRFDDHARLYLAAYNMGQSNVDSALDRKIWPKDYPIHIMKHYVSFYETLGPASFLKSKPADKAIAPSEQSGDKMRVVVRYNPHPKKAKPADFASDDDDMYFDVDKLVHPGGDLNSNTAESAEIGTDINPAAAAEAELKPRARPNRS